MKTLTKNHYANFYLNAAAKIGLDYEIINERIGLARIFDEFTQLEISSNIIGVNTQISSSLSVNKVKTSVLLSEKGIPVPAFKTFKKPEEAISYSIKKLNENKYLVIKPINGSLSLGITVKPSNQKQIEKAVGEAFEGNLSIMIEEYIEGKHYRVTVLDDEIIAITERMAAYVEGDGKNTINNLISEKNKLREKRKLPPITIREKDLSYLQNEKISLADIPSKDQCIILQLGCDMEIGGERKRIYREEIPEENKSLFLNAAKALNLRFAGIDYISPDIMTPYISIKTAINEINSAPDSDVHYRSSYPFDNYAAERIIKKIFTKKIPVKRSLDEVLLPTITLLPSLVQ